MLNLGIFDNTNYNYIIAYLREIFKIDIIKEFKVFNAFSMSNMANNYDVLLVLADITNNNGEKLKHVINKSKIVIINNDDNNLKNIIKSLKFEDKYIVNYGFNQKSTLTISSIDKLENKVMCSLQRDMVNIFNEKVEPFEFEINKGKSNFNNNKLLGIIELLLVLGYIRNKG